MWDIVFVHNKSMNAIVAASRKATTTEPTKTPPSSGQVAGRALQCLSTILFLDHVLDRLKLDDRHRCIGFGRAHFVNLKGENTNGVGIGLE